jgi:eukaryotic-like serine/threonine-protein kinase
MIGKTLGHYQITSQIGKGGMGEVYCARDTKLNRGVALKILPAEFANDAERMARFKREAQLLASLNHTNIAAIYGFEESGGFRALIMELAEGQTLAERILKGPIQLDDALGIARQIAEALEAAHEKGVIHRDLKPANVKVTPEGTVKVLDFGLAKALEGEAAVADISESPTLSLAATKAGVILGTAAYMAPEQARGSAVDKRCDIWSFGVVLFEMLTGRQLFAGETVADTLAAVLRADIDWNLLSANTPASIRTLLRRCLTKDRKQRLQAIGEARIAITEHLANPTETSRIDDIDISALRKSRLIAKFAWGVAIIGVLAALALSFVHFRAGSPLERRLRLSVSLPTGSAVGHIALSPNGRFLAINLYIEGKAQLWLRSLDSPDLKPLPDTEYARAPFWSPDSRSIGFFANGKLKTILASGGPVRTLCSAGLNGGGTWNRDDVILFAADSGPMQQVKATGGACEPLTKTEGRSYHSHPAFLPDGNHFLYTVGGGDQEQCGIYLAALKNPKGLKLLPDTSSAIFSSAEPSSMKGYLIFLRDSNLMAQGFDAASLQLTGDAFIIATRALFSYSTPQVASAVSDDGILVYLSDGVTTSRHQLSWVDRFGKELAGVMPQCNYDLTPSLSPDEKTICVQHHSSLWIRYLERNIEDRLTLPPLTGSYGVWSPNGSSIAFSSGGRLYIKVLSENMPEEIILQGDNARSPSDWSRDGHYLIYTEVDSKTRCDLWYLSEPQAKLGNNKPVPFLRTEFSESQGQLSPDGRWIAYTSDKSGEYAIYLRSFPSGANERRITNGISRQPRWRRDGNELFYLEGTAPRYHVMAIPMLNNSVETLEVGLPKRLFDLCGLVSVPETNKFSYNPSSDGKRFLAVFQASDIQQSLNVVTGWQKASDVK